MSLFSRVFILKSVDGSVLKFKCLLFNSSGLVIFHCFEFVINCLALLEIKMCQRCVKYLHCTFFFDAYLDWLFFFFLNICWVYFSFFVTF